MTCQQKCIHAYFVSSDLKMSFGLQLLQGIVVKTQEKVFNGTILVHLGFISRRLFFLWEKEIF